LHISQFDFKLSNIGVGIVELLETNCQPVLVGVELVSLCLQYCIVQRDEVKIRLWSRVNSSSQRLIELVRHVLNTRVNLHAHFGKTGLNFFRAFWQFLQELSRYEKKSFFWPSSEPIEGTAIDQGWELTASDSKCFSNR
jgi:hypothetical protein